MRAFAAAAAQRREALMAMLPAPSLAVLEPSVRRLPVEVRLADTAEVARNPGVVLGLVEEWAQTHSGRVGVICQLAWPGRRRAEAIECLRHEALVNDQLADREVSMLCPYDVERLEAEVVEGACLTHPIVVEGGRRRDNERYRSPQELLAPGLWPQEPPRDPVCELSFEGDLQRLRAAVAGLELVEGLGAQRRADLVFAVNEAVTNVVKHADGRCRVRIWHDGAAVVAEVRSRSRLPDPAAGRRRPPPDRPGGRGLWLVNQLCDLGELRSDDDATWVRVHVLDPSRLAARATGTTGA